MFYTYVLKSCKKDGLYVGKSKDLKQRVEDHNKGIGGEYTKKMRPLKLVFYEAFLSEEDAEKQERFYKTGYGKEVLKDKIAGSLKI